MNRQLSDWLKNNSWVQAVPFGIFLGIGFIVPALWWLGIVAIVSMTRLIKEVDSYRKLIKIFVIIWGVKSLCSIIWFWSSFPIDWVGEMSEPVQWIIIGAYWASSSLWLTSGGILLAVVALWITRQKFIPSYSIYFALPIVWLVSELFSTLVFSVFTAGPGSLVQTYFSFGMVGYLLGTTAVGIWISAIAGVYGLSLMMVILAVAMYVLSRRLTALPLVGVYLVLFTVISLLNPTSDAQRDYQTNVIAIDTQFDADYLSTQGGIEGKAVILSKAVDAALNFKPDVVLLPEDSRYLATQFSSDFPNQAMSQFLFLHGNSESIVIDSGRHIDQSGETVLRANVFDGVSKKIWQFDKQYLVPQGEYVPALYGGVLRLLGYGKIVERVAKDSNFRPGSLVQIATLPDYIPGVLFCFESVSPVGVRSLSLNRALPFVAHPISHGWFHNPTILWQQLDVMLQIQARFSGVPIVSAGNMASGKLYLPNGVIKTGVIVGSGERYTLNEFRF